jgi:hypothetical protein
MLFAGEPWHYWMAVPIVIGGVALVIGGIAGYFRKVQSVKYPKR